jgi:RNA polymerase sigma factor (sigma-70 family)
MLDFMAPTHFERNSSLSRCRGTWDERLNRARAGSAFSASLDAILSASYPLLTAEEEVALGERVARGAEAAARLRNDHARPGDEKAVHGGEIARQSLILRNLRLVRAWCSKYRTQHLSVEDLFQEGLIGLDNAARRFDYRRGVKFSTYAVPWIRKAITEAIEKSEHPIRLSTHATDMRARITAARDSATDDAAVAQTVGVSLELVRSFRRWERGVDSLDRVVNENGERLGDLLSDTAPSLSDQVVAREQLQQLLAILSPDDRAVLLLEFDLECVNDHQLNATHTRRAHSALLKVRRAAFGDSPAQ